jgi:DNA-binding winged helix-turn-helix (wHTH) protein/tetratricopeptide (TPR) repeat protein
MIYRFADCVLDAERRELTRAGQIVAIEPQVFDLLALFAGRPDCIVSRNDLIETVWGGRFVSDATIDSRIAAARRAIGDSGSTQAVIRTVPRRGFRFVSAVSVAATADPYPQPALPDLPSIVVLPFDNHSDNPLLGSAADILVEDVTALLARQGGFFVICSRSAVLYRDRTIDLRTVGRELGVRYVVTGSVRDVGGEVSVAINLVDARTGEQRWSGHLTAPAPALVDLQRDLARCVISEIEPALNSAELEVIRRRSERDIDAWALYRTAQATIATRGWHPGTFGEVRELLRQAVRLDPGFALGWAYLTLQTALAEVFGFLPRTPKLHAEIRSLANTAMDADPNDSQVMSWSACAYADIGDITTSVDLTERAIELDPSNAHAWMLRGMLVVDAGRIEEGLADVRRGLRLSPRDRRLGKWTALLAGCLLRAGRPEEALREARLAYLRDSNIYIAKLIEALAAVRLGRLYEARLALTAVGDVVDRVKKPELRHFLSDQDADDLLGIWRVDHAPAIRASGALEARR